MIHECIHATLSGSMAVDSFLAVQQPKYFYGVALVGTVSYSFHSGGLYEYP